MTANARWVLMLRPSMPPDAAGFSHCLHTRIHRSPFAPSQLGQSVAISCMAIKALQELTDGIVKVRIVSPHHPILQLLRSTTRTPGNTDPARMACLMLVLFGKRVVFTVQ